ncbi:MAG: hypothetical protein JXN10_11680 [Clostridia bacterium]|nr:hypothetical protein [Clostridia bacterium]MBN2884181.1 hypothetical protein [Clostridia bacterium]
MQIARTIGSCRYVYNYLRIPAHPDTQTGNIRTAFRKHSDTCQPIPF